MKRIMRSRVAGGPLLGVALLATLLPAGPTRVLAQGPWTAAPAGLPLGWTTYLGGAGKGSDNAGDAVAVDGQGNIYVTGHTDSAGFPITRGAAQPGFGGGDADAFVASYDRDGHLRWATYLGGKGDDGGGAIAVDGHGDIYLTGQTSSDNFPVTPGAAQPHLAGDVNVFVASYDAGGHLRWATYLGGGNGDGYGDYGKGIAVDGQGGVYVTGETGSGDFPVTRGAAQLGSGGGNTDAFVASYDGGGHLRWATYLGGKGADQGEAIAVDGQGRVYVTGATSSDDFPVTRGAAQSDCDPGSSEGCRPFDAFVASYGASGHLRWATLQGGDGGDEGNGIAVDEQGDVYVTGQTNSDNFPVTPGAAQPRYGGGDSGTDYAFVPSDAGDAFVASYGQGGHLRWATYLGGKGAEEGDAIAVDGHGGVYLTGQTSSDNFPVTPGASQPRRGGSTDAFVASYETGGRLRWATYLGGKGADQGEAIAVDGQGSVSVAGQTFSTDLPVTAGAALSVFGSGTYSSAFVARLVVPASRPAALGPASPPAPGTSHARFFPTTRHTLAGLFLTAWDRLGGIPTLGLPLSEPFVLGGQRVQVTERSVLVRSGGQVTLLPLGRLLSAVRVLAPVVPVPSTATRRYFPSTGHRLAGPFLAYWQAHQGSVLLGPPIAEPDLEQNGDGTGRVYTVQWFENGRLELHPEIKDPHHRVLQGRVGYEYLHRAGLL